MYLLSTALKRSLQLSQNYERQANFQWNFNAVTLVMIPLGHSEKKLKMNQNQILRS